MNDDWQDAAFSTRHMHNRVGAHGKSRRAKAFDVQRVFGSYTLKCVAWQKAVGVSQTGRSGQSASLEVYRTTDDGEGVVGLLSLPSLLEAAVVLAASRVSLQGIVADLENNGAEQDSVAETIHSLREDNEEDHDSDDDYDAPAKNRFETFEKNSFRSPKFWFQWSGVPMDTTANASNQVEKTQSGLGYIVFTGNDCRKFKGTLNCESFNWKNVPFTGQKLSSRSATDIPVVWEPGKTKI
ncbi:hypothetical protein NX059_006093 [Plenodomus lindquistii]|nr:hypothetical protein NX059_006093 [Plenodomus lindquistii]